ncbi:hypothetical protein NQ317_019790 [Molorchus minor]|uniref:Uncharacterized protein n=1 Tax=Molorchus minor TaxID=1323400 RepID=A0ABQ9K5G6_9CUCU|nr:hypothetical protein NQ317_019790 [Molorchus minor]
MKSILEEYTSLKAANITFSLKKIFKTPKWSIPELQIKKQELNKVKSLIGNFQLNVWTKYAAYRDPSGLVMKTLSENIQPELLTQAWCKFFEILGQFPMITKDAIDRNGELTSLHLCEAPGAFVCALNHYLVLNYPDVQVSLVTADGSVDCTRDPGEQERLVAFLDFL